jgi:hypothetical protein
MKRGTKHLGDPDMGARIILKRTLKEYGEGVNQAHVAQ